MQEQIKQENEIIRHAMRILSQRVNKDKQLLSSPNTVKEFLTVKLAEKEHEVFGIMWLDAKNRLIACDELFTGTIAVCTVYPREIVKAGLKHNARSAILYHNHPSGDTKASTADLSLTKTVFNTLKMVDIAVLDHIIVAGTATSSFSEMGYMDTFE